MSYFDMAVAKMRPPSSMDIICIDITNKCDLACSNCTRLLENQDELWDMSLENFRAACRSLADFHGTIAVIGGNPCMHRNFEEISLIFEQEIQDKTQRGLWSNNIFKHQELVTRVYGGFNLNAHGEIRGISSLTNLHKRVKKGNLYLKHSHHSPLLTAVRDIYEESVMWEKISGCDINREWSATLIENKGRLRAYFCEVAASFDLANNLDRGLDPHVGWWKRPMHDFGSQIQAFCPSCGVPARLKGHLDYEETDTYTETNRHLAEKSSRKGRKVIFLEKEGFQSLGHKVTDYTDSHIRNRGIVKRVVNAIKRRMTRFI